MHVDPPKHDSVDALLQSISKTIRDNQNFLKSLKQDRDDEGDVEDNAKTDEADEEFEEL